MIGYRVLVSIALLLAFTTAADAKKPTNCGQFHLDPNAHQSMQEVTLPPLGTCVPRESHGFLLPDPTCTPGAVNPTLTIEVLQNKKFHTTCVRDGATSAAMKNKTYNWYGIKKPRNNSGRTQRCELDHVISLELGGSDELSNIWPQCSFEPMQLKQRAFKQKDAVENYLAREVKAGRMPLEDAQRGISEDWTQYIDDANAQ